VLQPQTPPEKKSIGKLQKESQQLLAEVHLTLQLCELFVALCRGSPGARLAHSQALSLENALKMKITGLAILLKPKTA